MEPTYKSLKELVAAIQANEIDTPTVWIDNDNISSYDDTEQLFAIHPRLFIEEALELLGIPWESV